MIFYNKKKNGYGDYANEWKLRDEFIRLDVLYHFVNK